jgi:hypothetical protein
LPRPVLAPQPPLKGRAGVQVNGVLLSDFRNHCGHQVLLLRLLKCSCSVGERAAVAVDPSCNIHADFYGIVCRPQANKNVK